jgi:PPM family protein phosphatase
VDLSVAARTDVGRIRAGNEDSLYAEADQERGLFIVADGMGGHAAGEIASEMAVQIVARELVELRDPTDAEAASRMSKAIQVANRSIWERTIAEAEKQGMGTTASALLLGHGRYLIGHVGDSRVYRLRGGRLEQITKDHSYVQEQVDAGFLTPDQARVHPYSNVITRCIGANEKVEPDVLSGELLPGDVFLIASDGLTGMLEDTHLLRYLGAATTPGRKVDGMISEANRRGGLDNITAIVIHVRGVDGVGAVNTGEHPAFGPTGEFNRFGRTDEHKSVT